ncbi:hypothetical protein [Leptospira interrogans]|uniref:hypothetical protein n=1 Tax=Leptospira interrogans TaxID=173 RepID=UPI0013904D1E|nr:hypothetical protein [Leptospira interrogans]UMQ54291.1 hypothetical protein FH582_20770 [Leptospira interrogans]
MVALQVSVETQQTPPYGSVETQQTPPYGSVETQQTPPYGSVFRFWDSSKLGTQFSF